MSEINPTSVGDEGHLHSDRFGFYREVILQTSLQNKIGYPMK